MSPAQALLDIPPLVTRSQDLRAEASTTTFNDVQTAVVETLGNESLVPLQSPTPVVPPTSSRSLRGQSSKSFSKGKDVALAVPGSSASPIIGEASLKALHHIGMKPADTSESAQQARSRLNVNEARLAEFVAKLEQTAAIENREQSKRLQEVSLLIADVRTACEQQMHSPAVRVSDSIAAVALVDNPVVQQLRSAVVEDRNRITDMIADLRQLRTDLDGQSTHRPAALLPIPPLPIPPIPAFNFRQKRPLDDRSSPPRTKRFRAASEAYQLADVLYGPVDTEGNPKAIACAAMEIVDGLNQDDVYSAKYVHGQPGVISIRFQSQDAADRFVAAMEVEPILEGQTAVPAGVSTPGQGIVSRQSSGPSPRDIISGVGKSPRRRR